MTKSKKISKEELAQLEKGYINQYKKKIVPNTIRYGTGDFAGKVVIKINLRGIDGKFNGKTMIVATSDLHQTNHSKKDAEALRRKRRNENARDKRRAMKAAEAIVSK